MTIHLRGRNLKRPAHPEISDFYTTSNTDTTQCIYTIMDLIPHKGYELQ